MKKILIKQEDSGQRIDNFLIKNLKGVPKSLFYRLLRKGVIKLNGKKAKPEYKVCPGDELRLPEIDIASPKELTIPNSIVSLISNSIIYQDEDLLVINKPAGIAVHGGSNLGFGVIDVLRTNNKDQYFELVHRLDKETSGCLLVAKKREVLVKLQQLFVVRQVEKKYLALVKGLWPKAQRSINLPLNRGRLTSGERLVKAGSEGQEATTYIQLLEQHEDTSLVLAMPVTGRMHQIRVHLASSGFPIAGDQKYGDKNWNKELRSRGFSKLFLHCQSLCFNISKAMAFSAAPDDKLLALLHSLGYKYNTK